MDTEPTTGNRRVLWQNLSLRFYCSTFEREKKVLKHVIPLIYFTNYWLNLILIAPYAVITVCSFEVFALKKACDYVHPTRTVGLTV